MNEKNQKPRTVSAASKSYSYGSLLLLFLIFGALVMLSANLLTGMRLDLTENKLYTLSDGTANILDELEEPVNLYLFFSEEASRDLPQIRTYAKRVRELMEEFANHAGDNLNLEFVDPTPFSEQEDQAAGFGLQAVPVGAGGETLYFGVAGTNAFDDLQVIPFLQANKEQFLEYDLAKMVYTLGAPKKRTVGLLTGLPMTAGYDPVTQSMREAWVVYDQLQQLFDVQTIDPASGDLPLDIEALVLVHPRDVSDSLQYQIDQFVLGGGRAIVFLDPFAEVDRGDPNDPMASMSAGSSSSLDQLTEAWGVEFDSARVLGDLQYGIGQGAARHIGILSVPSSGLDQGDIVTADLEVVNLTSVGWLSPIESATTTVDPLMQSSENAAPMDSSRFRFLSDPATLLDGFSPTGENYILGARISGPASSAFESPPEGFEPADHVTDAGEDGINVLLFADVDMLTDRLWVQKQPFLGQTILSQFADNGSLAVNAVDNMLGNQDLISIRTRASSNRPFDRVEALQADAEMQYRETEQSLQEELSETERILTELQAARGDDDLLVLSAEQQEEVDRFVQRKLEIRQELRQVQHELRADIEKLGTRLKFVNIAVVPALVMVVALIFALRRRSRARQSHESLAHETRANETQSG
ncbi:MAG TPA: Gldg family protein [Xanthomonadales bacterium]|nr:Gldg family protein [Xanthomonadales bacterium]